MPTAVKTLSRQRASNDARHLMRYLKSKANVPLEDIARADHISVKQVKESIRQMAAFESINSEGHVQLLVRDMVRVTLPKVQQAIEGLLEATNTVEQKNQRTGLMEYTNVPDKITRLDAVKVYTGLLATTQPKVPGVNVQVSQQNHNQTAVLSSTETNEERLRRLRAMQAEHNLLPPVVIGTPKNIDAGYDPDEDSDEEDD
jgi:DNA-binding IscR family transcriptional regulator